MSRDRALDSSPAARTLLALVGAARCCRCRWDEIPAAELGVALEAWDPDGKPVIEQEGELVVTKPLPSMPLSS